MSPFSLTKTNFTGGMNSEATFGGLQPNECAEIKGAFVNDYGMLSHPGTFTSVTATTAQVVAMVTDANPTTGQVFLVYLTLSGTTYSLWTYNLSTLSATQVATWNQNAYNTTTPTNSQVRLISGGGFVIIQAQEVRIYRVGTSVVTAGYLTSNVDGNRYGTNGKVASVTKLPGGNLHTTNTNPPLWYRYMVVEEDEYGNLTNPGLVSDAFNTNDGGTNDLYLDFQLTITGISVANNSPSLGSGYNYNAPGKGYVWVFRYGGQSSRFRFVGKFRPSLANANADLIDWNQQQKYIDKKGDLSLPDIFPSFANDAPPRNVRASEYHLNRLFLAGQAQDKNSDCLSTSHLWFSRTNHISAFGYDDNGVDDDGGYYILDGQTDDGILQMVSFNGVLVIGRRRSVYVLYGDRYSNFRFDKRSTIGVASPLSMARYDNRLFFVASDKTVREYGDSFCPTISRNITSLLRSVPSDLLGDTRTYVFNQRLIICLRFSTTLYRTFALDLRYSQADINQSQECWTELGADWNVQTATQVAGTTTSGELLYVAPMGTGISRHSFSNGNVSFNVRMGYVPAPDSDKQLKANAFSVRGELMPGTVAPKATLTCGENFDQPLAVTVEGGSYLVNVRKLPASLTGQGVDATLTGDWLSGKIEAIHLEGAQK